MKMCFCHFINHDSDTHVIHLETKFLFLLNCFFQFVNTLETLARLYERQISDQNLKCNFTWKLTKYCQSQCNGA